MRGVQLDVRRRPQWCLRHEIMQFFNFYAILITHALLTGTKLSICNIHTLSSAITVRLYVCHEIIGLCNTVYLFSSKKRLRLHGSFWTRDKGSSRNDRISIQLLN